MNQLRWFPAVITIVVAISIILTGCSKKSSDTTNPVTPPATGIALYAGTWSMALRAESPPGVRHWTTEFTDSATLTFQSNGDWVFNMTDSGNVIYKTGRATLSDNTLLLTYDSTSTPEQHRVPEPETVVFNTNTLELTDVYLSQTDNLFHYWFYTRTYPNYSIAAGMVVDTLGNPLQYSVVTLNQNGAIHSTSTGAPGTFGLDSLVAGIYYAHAARGGVQTPIDTITVTAGTVVPLQFVIH